jgi:hypothetical protein
MRPRALTAMPWSFAYARTSPLRSRLDAVRPGRRRCPRPAFRAWSMNGASLRRKAVAFFAEVDLIPRAIYTESHRFFCRASIKVVFEFDRDPLCHPGLRDCDGVSAPYKINRHPAITTPSVGRAPGTVPRQAAWRDGFGPRLHAE